MAKTTHNYQLLVRIAHAVRDEGVIEHPWVEVARRYSDRTGRAFAPSACQQAFSRYVHNRPEHERRLFKPGAVATTTTPANHTNGTTHPSDRVAGAMRSLVALVVDDAFSKVMRRLDAHAAALSTLEKELPAMIEAGVKRVFGEDG